MNKFFLGFGGCSKYYKYILGTVLFKCIRDCMFGFNTINPDSKIGLFGFIPELSNHFLIQSLYRYSSFILGGALFIYISQKKSENETEKISNNKEKESLEFKGLIHNKKSDGSEIARIRDILKIKKKVNFVELFDDFSKPYVVVTFLSVLEMAKNKEITLKQDNNFSDIYLERVD